MKQTLFFLLILAGCSGLERSEKEKIKKANLSYQPIFRLHDEAILGPNEAIQLQRDKYPWEKQIAGRFYEITKEFFRCKGSASHPEMSIPSESSQFVLIKDCGGIDKHSLPVKNQKEFIYPVLIELLNFIQKQLQAKVVITCGHRCPAHNTYSDPSTKAKISKHQIGAEVDFYVEGYEHKPHEIVQLVKQFYQENPRYSGLKEFQIFSLVSDSQDPNRKSAFQNKEILVRLVKKNEGRDFDNRHPYPYLTIEVKYDIEEQRRVDYSWKEAHQGFMQN